MKDREKTKIVIITTVPITLIFFKYQIIYLKNNGYEVHCISSDDPFLWEMAQEYQISVHALNMPRTISPLEDVKSIIKMIYILKNIKPMIVHAHTPKAGYLGTLASRICGIPIILYTIHGLPFVTAKGVKKILLYLSELLSCRIAHHLFAVSRSIMDQAIQWKLCSKKKIEVIAKGSISGVDAKDHFNPEYYPEVRKKRIKKLFNIPLSSTVIGYVGRIVKDKGIQELYYAWKSLRNKYDNLYLLMIGPEECKDPIDPNIMDSLKKDLRVIFTGMVKDPAPYYAIIDILVLPTYREGFPVVPLEAAAMEIPVVTTYVDGCKEAVINGKTGIIVPPYDPYSLEKAIEILIKSPAKRELYGKAARQRVITEFKPEKIIKELNNKYLMFINKLKYKNKADQGVIG